MGAVSSYATSLVKDFDNAFLAVRQGIEALPDAGVIAAPELIESTTAASALGKAVAEGLELGRGSMSMPDDETTRILAQSGALDSVAAALKGASVVSDGVAFKGLLSGTLDHAIVAANNSW